jgi:uncharacterized lipoprotein YddW (UPF0748 family)
MPSENTVPPADGQPLTPTLHLPLVASGQPAAAELRAAWVDAWHDGLFSAAQITRVVDTLRAANYNLIIAEVRRCGDALYTSAYEPRAVGLLTPPPFDPLADLVGKAHRAGLQVYAWLVTYRIWDSQWPTPPAGHVWREHPEWAMQDRDGNLLDNGFYSLDPGVPLVQDYICRVAMDVIARYEVDGINWDYIRYPGGYYWGYNPITAQRFFDEYGYWPPLARDDPEWETWATYRRQQITDLVKKCYLEAAALKPGLAISASTVAWMGGDPNVDYRATCQYAEVFQDSQAWLSQHVVDVVTQMNYKRGASPQEAADYRLWSDFLAHSSQTSGRYCLDGQGAWLNSIPNTLAQMDYARRAGCQGLSTYSYASTNKDGRPADEFWSAVARQPYALSAASPVLPWKVAPSGGIVFGTLTHDGPPDPAYMSWVYGAQVTIQGPVARQTRSDATGTYGFLDLPAGTYDLVIEAPGRLTERCDGVALEAGSVVRKDVRMRTPTW